MFVVVYDTGSVNNKFMINGNKGILFAIVR